MSQPGSVTLFARAVPCALAFLSSFGIMAVEVAAGRMVAGYVGAGLYTWTSVIGVVLGGLTLGNLAGGRLADRFDARKTLAVLFYVAAILCLALPLWNFLVGRWFSFDHISTGSFQLRVASHVLVVFLLPATALGLIGPVVAKLALDLGRRVGSTLGNVYAWGALGSIVGTFATGFYLISALGMAGVMLAAGGGLSAVSMALSARTAGMWIVVTWPLLVGCLAGSSLTAQRGLARPIWSGGKMVLIELGSEQRIYADESAYSFIRVTEDAREKTRSLLLDTLLHSVLKPSEPEKLIYPYETIYASLTERFRGDRTAIRTLFIGGGGYIFPRYVRHRWPTSTVEVAEIDPAVTEANFVAFGLRREDVRIHEVGGAASGDPAGRMEVFHMDARNHVEDLLKLKRAARTQDPSSPAFEPYDFIYGDAFNDYCVPFHLVTVEFFGKLRELLRPRTGIYLMNVIDIYDSGLFMGAIYNTVKEVFPYTYILSLAEGGPRLGANARETYIFVGAQEELDLRDLGKRPGELGITASVFGAQHIDILRARSGGVVLNDDYAPVENLLAPVVRRRALRQ